MWPGWTRSRGPLDEAVVPPPVLDQVGDGDHLQAVPLAVPDEIGDPGHRPVVVHDLADHAGRNQAGEPGEVDRRLGLAGAVEDAPRPGAKREDVTWLHEVVRAGRRVDGDLDRARAVVRRDSGRDALTRFDGDRERGAQRRLVPLRHLAQVELLAALRGQAQADQPPGVGRHEVDRLRRDELRRDRQIAFVLAIRVVDDDDESS